MLGKRVDYSARSVISSDSFLDVDEIGLPLQIADKLTVPEHVCSWNFGTCPLCWPRKRSCVERNGRMIDPTYRRNLYPQLGDVFHRYLQNGDYVLATGTDALAVVDPSHEGPSHAERQKY